MSFFSSITSTKEFSIDTSVSFSENNDIAEIQKKAEELRIHQAIKNIVNSGNPMKDRGGKVEWESCLIHYEPVSFSSLMGNTIIGHITMSDGTTLYESMFKSFSKTRYTEIFRFGKWVERFLQYSEELSTQYTLEVENRKKEMKDKELKPFSDIDF